jgi:hypothetical protein
MNAQAPSIASLLGNLGITARTASLLTVGMTDADMPDFETVHAYETLSGPETLPTDLRVQLGIVVVPPAPTSRRDTEQLLARLRDVHCEKVLLVDTAGVWEPDELRPLGYLEVEGSQADGRCYLFDPDVFNQPREWNNPSDWANPENFGKYRW